MKKWMAVVVFAALAQAAFAFPTWIGVYGSFVHHDDPNNPGTFTILMNQDYYGLNANVGIQVNGGAWKEYAMSYAGNVGGNSKWTHTPAAPFPAGATVKYYFHGHQGSQHIYDNNTGYNYQFKAPVFGASQSVGAESYLVDADAFGNYTFLALANAEFRVARRDAQATNWYSWRTLLADTNGFFDCAIAASENDIVAVATPQQGVYIRTSHDKGNTYGVTNLVVLPAGWASEVDAAYMGGSRFQILCRVAYNQLYLLTSTNRGDTWTYEQVDSAFYVGQLNIGAVQGGAVLCYERYLGQRASEVVAAMRSNSSTNWEYVTLLSALGGGSVGRVALATDYAAGSFVAGIDDYAITRVWSFNNGVGNSHFTGLGGNGPKEIGLYYESDGTVVLLRRKTGTGAELRKMAPGSSSFDYATASDVSGGTAETPNTVMMGVTTGSGVPSILWRAQTGTYTYPLHWQPGGRPAFSWIGNTYQWPPNGQVGPNNNLWINTETWRLGSVVNAYVIYSTNGVNWLAMPMGNGGRVGNNDWWHVGLGKFPSGTTLRYAIMAVDAQGATRWDNNGGADYQTTVN